MSARLVAFPPPYRPSPAEMAWREDVARRMARRASRQRVVRAVDRALSSPVVGVLALTVAALTTAAAVLAPRAEWVLPVVGAAIAITGSALVLAIALVWCESVPPARPRSAPPSCPPPAAPGRDGSAA